MVGLKLSFAFVAHLIKFVINVLLTAALLLTTLVTLFYDPEVASEDGDIIHANEMVRRYLFQVICTAGLNLTNAVVSLFFVVNGISSLIHGYLPSDDISTNGHSSFIEIEDDTDPSKKQNVSKPATASNKVRSGEIALANSIWGIFSSPADDVIHNKLLEISKHAEIEFDRDGMGNSA